MVSPDHPDKYRVLEDAFGFSTFRSRQEEIVDAVLSGRNVLAVMPTGAGKSLCFQLPALVKGGLSIVVSPLIALMDDQVAALKLSGQKAEAIHSGKSREENVEIWRRVTRGEVSLLYMSPERLMTPRMQAALTKFSLGLIAVDEAHCISQWGHSFRAEYLMLGALREAFPGVPIIALTATADRSTRDDISEKLFGGDVSVFVSGFDRPNISITVADKTRAGAEIERFVKSRGGQSGIVYRISRKKVEDTAAALSAAGIRALAYHAGMPPADRAANQEAFLAEPGIVMVATVAFGMGIDKSDVRFVVHGDVPSSLEAYYQEIGRAGRDGEPADAYMLYGLEDVRTRRRFIDEADCEPERRRVDALRLDALIGFCEATSCRRVALLAYFGESSQACGNCDICLDPPALADGRDVARLAIDLVRTTGERYGAAYIVSLLTGETNDMVLSRGHDSLPLFAAGSSRKKAEWRSILRQLVAARALHAETGAFGSLMLGEKAEAVLSGNQEFLIRLPSPGKSRRSKRGSAPERRLNGPETELLVRLKALRREIAAEQGVPAYVVFPDRTLEEMVVTHPRSLDDMARVRGVGAAKLEAFGRTFLDALNG
ncbi:DNA helicase RecQ [Microbaculum marinisediminis]|uniref:DNA helicase RecQ n=1 Tax=Microbaculum marinisediminis TaxID=2931392 RepID=A0AAW5R2K7_9HYPH|nr:DNA helicase RecQ [Microbaculum sp. A6E488]MCT8974490.1 DNA helicase RecQ [Microbaculum sp. A6E488]